MGLFNRRTLTSSFSTAVAAACMMALAACGGGDDSDSGSGTDPAEDAGLTLPEVDGLEEIRDTLAGTDYECINWSDVDDGVASCVLPGDGGIHGVHMAEDPTTTATVIFQRSEDSPGVVMGKNWVFDCGPGNDLGRDRCGEIASIFDATLIEPDPQ